MPFEDEPGDALRPAGDGFTADPQALAAPGEQRGRRPVVRRRAAVVGGSVLALAVIGAGGAYAGGLFGSSGTEGGPVHAAAEPAPPTGPDGGSGSGTGSGPPRRTGTGAVSADQLVGALRQLLLGGTLTDTEARGTGDPEGPMVSGVYDDGKGGAAVAVSLSRVHPTGAKAAAAVTCPEKFRAAYDACESTTRPDGSRLMIYQGYEYPDRREPTKRWQAVLVTAQGFRVDVQEWNAPAEKGAPVSRPQPPLDRARLAAVATSPLWHAALNGLPAAAPDAQQPLVPAGGPDAAAVLPALLPTDGATVIGKGGTADHAYVVLDDGRGGSLVQVNVQKQMGELLAGYFTNPRTTVLADGTKVLAEKKNGEKGGAGVVMWTVDTLRPDGRRVVISAFNTADQNKAASRAEPLLTIEQLRQVALDPQWTG
ncbi:hypothetical protein ACFVGY_14120 [Streptomyces sp. NPDC127106]|uniref:hypothetical protein n=1 Tax=Streptomyces sp. NPDC127106 TaxID=3345360 RepID=UPI00362D0FAA